MNRLDSLLQKSPKTITLNSSSEWARLKNTYQFPYAKLVFDYAELWGRLMEGEINQGKKLKDIAADCATLADTVGMTGWSSSFAAMLLSKYWIHGIEFQLWRNSTRET